MAFKKLIDCDESDMGLWANNICAENFFGEAHKERETALRSLIDAKCKDRDQAAAVVRAWDSIMRLYEEVREMK